MTAPHHRSHERLAQRRADLERALQQGELVLHYQPIVAMGSGQVRGAEALLRWQHPVGGLLGPDDFLPELLQLPEISDVTRWVLQEACRTATEWPEWEVAVNITARDVLRPDFVDDVIDALALAALPPERLVLELTETDLVQDLPLAADTLRRVRALGCGVALDDFGTGYSSMLYLRDLPVTVVKIDRTFVRGVAAEPGNREIVSSLLALIRAVGLTSVGEGVETACDARVLRSLGCVLGQGYLWRRPVPAHELIGFSCDALPGVGVPEQRSDGSHADPRLDVAAELLSQGASLHTIAAALNAAGHRTDRGTRWKARTVAQLVNAIALDPPAPRRDPQPARTPVEG
jgi:EAL domain-containing protein (putative c-di-GMP-specific phosphodiesterase class I)